MSPVDASAGPALVGLDLGTQSVRALVVSRVGEVLGSGRAALTSRRRDDRHEQDPEEWWRAVCAALRGALSEAHPMVEPADLGGLAVCATSGTVLAVDDRGRPAGPALMYDDARATAEADRLTTAGAATWAEYGYHRLQAVWGAPKLLWLQEHGAAGSRLLTQTDFVNQRLCGGPVPADVSSSLKSGCDAATLTWPTDVLAAAGLATAALPELVLPGTPIGVVGTGAAAETGLPEGLVVHAGMTDGYAAQMASGATSAGSWNVVLGTTLALKGVTSQRLADPAGVVYSHRSPAGDAWLPGGAANVGAAAVARVLAGRTHAELTQQAAGRPPSEVVVYPLVPARGERFPFVAPDATAFTCGEPTDDVDLYLAHLQGVALVERLCLDYLDLLGAPTAGPVHLTGAATTNQLWTRLRCDVSGRTTLVPAVTEPALGAAVVAASHDDGLARASGAMVRTEQTYEPRPADWVAPAYHRLVGELERRGWLPTEVADHARARSAA